MNPNGVNPNAPTRPIADPSHTDGADANVSELPELSAPTVGFADPTAAALAALAKLMHCARDQQNAVRKALQEDQVAAENASVEALHAKANATRTAAWASAACDVTASIGTVMDAFGTSTQDLEKRITSQTSKLGEGISQVFLKASDTASQFGDAAATDHEADSKQADAKADTLKSQSDDAHDRAKDYDDLAQKVYDTIKSIQDSRQAAAMAILRQPA